jgi:hypothetical protein
MGNKNIHKTAPEKAVKEEPGDKPDDLPHHLGFGELIFPPVITHGPPQPRDDEAVLVYHPGPHMNGPGTLIDLFTGEGIAASPGVILKLFQVMIAKHKKEGFIKAGYDKIQILHGKIPGAEDYVHIGKPLLDITGINQGVYLIGYTKNLHGEIVWALLSM